MKKAVYLAPCLWFAKPEPSFYDVLLEFKTAGINTANGPDWTLESALLCRDYSQAACDYSKNEFVGSEIGERIAMKTMNYFN